MAWTRVTGVMALPVLQVFLGQLLQGYRVSRVLGGCITSSGLGSSRLRRYRCCGARHQRCACRRSRSTRRRPPVSAQCHSSPSAAEDWRPSGVGAPVLVDDRRKRVSRPVRRVLGRRDVLHAALQQSDAPRFSPAGGFTRLPRFDSGSAPVGTARLAAHDLASGCTGNSPPPREVRLERELGCASPSSVIRPPPSTRRGRPQPTVIMGDGDVIGQAVEQRLVDELHLHLAPMVLGGGTPLFKTGTRQVYRQRDVCPSLNAVHLVYERV